MALGLLEGTESLGVIDSHTFVTLETGSRRHTKKSKRIRRNFSREQGELPVPLVPTADNSPGLAQSRTKYGWVTCREQSALSHGQEALGMQRA